MQVPWLEDILNGFSQRMNNILVFMPFFELSQKTKYPYDLPALGVAVMLFILEDMLRAERSCTYEAIAYFLQQVISRYYNEELDYDQALELGNFLVREGLMKQGRPHAFTYPDFETGTEKVHKFHLVELEDYDIKDRSVRLRLSTAGVEMLFKTKEMYNELQVSITQLYLRQQIQKGVFDGALRSVEELALAVKNEKQRIFLLQENIIRDVLQVAREKELEKQMERINEQLSREKVVFRELKELIDYTMEEYYSGKLSEKEEQAVEKIMKVRTRLVEIISMHESLFTDKIRVQNLMNRSVESLILTAFNTKVNFETDFLFPAVQKNISLDRLKKMLNPLFSANPRLFFHPGRVFEPQSLSSQEEELNEELLQEAQEEAIRREEELERKIQAEREKRMEKYLLMLLEPLTVQEETTVSNVLENLRKKDSEEYNTLVNQLDFYTFVVQLHQMGEIPLLDLWESQTLVLDELPRTLVKIAAANRNIRDIRSFELQALDKIIYFKNGYVMSDFTVRRGALRGTA
jgi:formate dehydrogenase maturation protein FdhE